MEEMRKSLFITGTVSKDIIEEIVKLLDYIGYDALYSDKINITEEVKGDRLKALILSDGLLCYGNNIGKYVDVYQQEIKTARYLDKRIIHYKRTPSDLSDIAETLESLVTMKVLENISNKEETKE